MGALELHAPVSHSESWPAVNSSGYFFFYYEYERLTLKACVAALRLMSALERFIETTQTLSGVAFCGFPVVFLVL